MIKSTYSLVIIINLFLNISCSINKVNIEKQENDLIIEKVTDGAYVHISYLQTESFGKVACNGAIFIANNEALIIDTPADSITSVKLINHLLSKNIRIKGVVINHFHEDCLGGLSAFQALNIKSYASERTILAAKQANVNVPQIGFKDNQTLKIGSKKVLNMYLGEAHTSDNIVSYMESNKTLFGGCMVKELNATKGYLGDANLVEWSKTIQNVRTVFPDVKYIIPGHGKAGDTALLDYTAELFRIN